MRSLSLEQSLHTFNRYFDSAQQNMFKAEVLQDYTAVDDSPSLREWLAGNTQKSRELGKAALSTINYRNRCLASPADITRVHAVEQPYTPYLEWEIAVCYTDSLVAYSAEKVLLADIRKLPGIKLPTGDFWIFDDLRVLQWEYKNGTGALVGGHAWDTQEGDNISHFQELQQKLLTVAEPLEF